MDTPIVEQLVALVDLYGERDEPWADKCPTFDAAEERRIPSFAASGQSKLTVANDPARLIFADTCQLERAVSLLTSCLSRPAGAFRRAGHFKLVHLPVRDEAR
jgi:hypothetical protein